MNALHTTFATFLLAATLPAHADGLIDVGVQAPLTVIAMPAGIGASTLAMGDQVTGSPQAEHALVPPDGDANARATLSAIGGVSDRISLGPLPSAPGTTSSTATSSVRFETPDRPNRPAGSRDEVRSAAVPDPGTLQVFGLGLVILATVAGTQRRKSI